MTRPPALAASTRPSATSCRRHKTPGRGSRDRGHPGRPPAAVAEPAIEDDLGSLPVVVAVEALEWATLAFPRLTRRHAGAPGRGVPGFGLSETRVLRRLHALIHS